MSTPRFFQMLLSSLPSRPIGLGLFLLLSLVFSSSVVEASSSTRPTPDADDPTEPLQSISSSSPSPFASLHRFSPHSSSPVFRQLAKKDSKTPKNDRPVMLNKRKNPTPVRSQLPFQKPVHSNRENEFIIHYQDVCPELATSILLDHDDMQMASAKGSSNFLQRFPLSPQIKDKNNKQKNGEHLLGGKITLSAGFFQKELYSEADMQQFDKTEFALWRRHFLRAIVYVLGGTKLSGVAASMSEEERRAFLEDPSKPTLLCGYLRKVQTDICHIHGLPDRLAALSEWLGGNYPLGSGPTGILAGVKYVIKQVYQGDKLKKVLQSLSCVTEINISVRNDVATANLPTAELYDKQWHLQNQNSQPYALRAPQAWQENDDWEADEADGDVGIRRGVVLAIIDTGCARHQDLWYNDKNTGQVSTVLWRNKGEYDCTDGIDNDGNGYVDDCWGYVIYKQ
eukprot:GHVS01086216.1.p1 GENE.GHVS01086216.1~~GHVS01086216.1.p1  ORF type:complete len:453 (+),score=67.37 GHVS01086216.1:152-1510(+)